MKVPSREVFIGEFYQMFKEDIILVLYNLFQKIEAEGTLISF